MAIKFFDRIKDTSETNGTGNITVSGTAAEGFKTFSTVLSGGEQFYYAITGISGQWETGIGTMISNNTFSRAIKESSTGALVNFSSGTKQVFLSVNSDYFKNIPVTTYTHDQVPLSSTWTITHNLNSFPNVVVIESGGSQVIGDIVYNSANQITLTFSAGITGKAYLS
jgi:hypothetical protein